MPVCSGPPNSLSNLMQNTGEYRRTKDAMKLVNSIFVFGSDLRGTHDRGAARTAHEKYGAIKGQARGLQGRSFAVPFKKKEGVLLDFDTFKLQILDFLQFARLAPNFQFIVTEIGTGPDMFKDEEIAPLFMYRPDNVQISPHWEKLAEEAALAIGEQMIKRVKK